MCFQYENICLNALSRNSITYVRICMCMFIYVSMFYCPPINTETITEFTICYKIQGVFCSLWDLCENIVNFLDYLLSVQITEPKGHSTRNSKHIHLHPHTTLATPCHATHIASHTFTSYNSDVLMMLDLSWLGLKWLRKAHQLEDDKVKLKSYCQYCQIERKNWEAILPCF